MMLCSKPFVDNGRAFGCGQCLPCRINRSRVWTHRLMLESTQHSCNSFWTLSYDEDHLCRTERGFATLVPAHLKDFIKRLRAAYSPLKIRYFGVGEYGDKTWRPHYHLALFGYPGCSRGQTLRVQNSGEPDWRRCCPPCITVGQAWGHGHIYGGTFEYHSAKYVAGYVLKGMKHDDEELLKGRFKEFTRMSLKPGIGRSAISDIASVVLSTLPDGFTDVPAVLRWNGRLFPLGRYLRDALREECGLEKGAGPETLEEYDEKLRDVREAAFDASESFGKAIVERFEGSRLSKIAKHEIYGQRRAL